MPTIAVEEHGKRIGFIEGLKGERQSWEQAWKELSDYLLPQRYTWLLTPQERARRVINNPKILDGTGTTSARILAAGMMSGITSPSRPWFRLRISGFDDDLNSVERVWLDEVQRRMLLIMAESNFYNSLAILYMDLVIFGTGAQLIYEDTESVIRCYNPALGEYFVGQSDRLQVNSFARQFTYTVGQIAAKWGTEYMSPSTKSQFDRGGSGLSVPVSITHLIEPNIGQSGISKNFSYRESYWETGAVNKGILLAETPFNEFPAIVARWELTANDSYGTSPAMDALGDIKQLQQETMEKGKSLNMLNNPPIIADIQLQHKPTAFMPRGVTYVSGITAGGVGAKPLYQVTPVIGEITADILDIRLRIREIFHNDLFQMISQLDTVRTATEIDARREEKLTRLGSVLERFENEALDPAIKRIFSIMVRAGLIPPAPASLSEADIEIQYVSILTTAQSAVAAIPTERFVAFVGNIAAIYPKALNIPNFERLIRDYGRDIGVPAKNVNSPEEVAALDAEADQLAASREAAAQGDVLVNSAKTLSETEVGGGANALQALIG